MSFKIIFLLIFAYGCGVKSLPTAPKDSAYPSYQSKFITKEKPEAKPTQAPSNQ